MQITWYGHSCFLLEAAGEPRVLLDPCDPETGYTLEGIEADIVTVSHAHHDHDYVQAVKGSPVVMRLAGERRVQGLSITGIPTWHDDEKGKRRGSNLMFLIEMDGIRVLHLGDLGHVPDADLVERIGRVDLLLVPVGGTYTIDAKGARQVLDLFAPSVCIPMHYKTDVLRLDIDGLDGFFEIVRDLSVHRLNEPSCTLCPGALGEGRIVLLDYKKH